MTDKRATSESHLDRSISDLYQSTREEEPENELDETILAKARVVVRQRRRRWLLPVSSAAVVLIGLTLTLKLVDQAPLLPHTEDVMSDEASYDAGPAHQSKKTRRLPAAKSELESSSSRRSKEEAGQLLRMAPARPSPQAGLESIPSRERFEQPGSPVTAGDPFTLLEQEKMSSPESWLAEIEAMIEAGEYAEAASSLEAFRRKYPEYPVSEPLSKLKMN